MVRMTCSKCSAGNRELDKSFILGLLEYTVGDVLIWVNRGVVCLKKLVISGSELIISS